MREEVTWAWRLTCSSVVQPWIGCRFLCQQGHVFEWIYSMRELCLNTHSVFAVNAMCCCEAVTVGLLCPAECPQVLNAAPPALLLCAGNSDSARTNLRENWRRLEVRVLQLFVSKEISPLQCTTWCGSAGHVRIVCFGYKCRVIALRFWSDLQGGLSYPALLPQFWFVLKGNRKEKHSENSFLLTCLTIKINPKKANTSCWTSHPKALLQAHCTNDTASSHYQI